MTTLYFSKINLNSHIFEVYDKKYELKNILQKLFLNIKEGIEYNRVDFELTDEGEKELYEASYEFKQILKFDDNTIAGSILKTSNLFINYFDESSNEIHKRPIKNSEIIQFFFNIDKEVVAFYTTNRFGYSEFNTAFSELINLSMASFDYNEKYIFDVSLIKEGLDLESIKSKLKNFGKLKKLEIHIIPPNPDDELLDNIQENYERYLEEIKSGNVTHQTSIFESNSPHGLNIDADIIDNKLDAIQGIHSQLTSEEAIANGYVKIEATNDSGVKYSTEKNKPAKLQLEDRSEDILEFATQVRDKVNLLINTLFLRG